MVLLYRWSYRPIMQGYVHSTLRPSFPERRRPFGKHELVLDAWGEGPRLECRRVTTFG